MLLILSARTVGEDIALQFGKLLPSFLPVGDRRLFTIQGNIAFEEGRAITVPEDFEISPFDRQVLSDAGFRIIPQPPGLSLNQAINHALGRIDLPEGELLRILYGDTLVSMPDRDFMRRDIVAVQNTTANYPWAYAQNDNGDRLIFSDDPPKQLESRRVVCGYFTFSDPALLSRACQERSIVDALNVYNSRKPLTCLEPGNWFDLGHLPLLFRSKKNILVKRAFNDLVYEDDQLLKQSSDTLKIRAEAHWYENLPGALRMHVPRYGGRAERDHRAGYRIEYLYHPLLSDVAAFGSLPLTSWLEILSASFDFIHKCHAVRPPEGAPEAAPEFADHFFDRMIVEKTRQRFGQYCAAHEGIADASISLDGIAYPPLPEVVETLIRRIPRTQPEHIRFWHGDLFFGNMFYDFTAQRIMSIDPRGQLSAGETSLFGDLRYDLAKLAHSIIGQYDKIVLGRSRLVEDTPTSWRLTVEQPAHQPELESIFEHFITESCNLDMAEITAMTALLFFSMLPLHAERPDLQKQFIATGLRLFSRLGDRTRT